MDPSVGRFASIDPFDGGAERPMSLHRYLYADASPSWKSDPSGNFSIAEVLFTAPLAGIILAMPKASYAGVVPVRIEVRDFRPYQDEFSAGADLKLMAILKNHSAGDPEYRWVQMVTTNLPNSQCAECLPDVPYLDAFGLKKPFFGGDAKHLLWKNEEPPNYAFFDGPRRNLEGNSSFYWKAELSLVLVSPKGNSSYTARRTLSWGFRYSKGTVKLDPVRFIQ
jgi:hypothetical protein